jgi:hypothetical protein
VKVGHYSVELFKGHHHQGLGAIRCDANRPSIRLKTVPQNRHDTLIIIHDQYPRFRIELVTSLLIGLLRSNIGTRRVFNHKTLASLRRFAINAVFRTRLLSLYRSLVEEVVLLWQGFELADKY